MTHHHRMSGLIIHNVSRRDMLKGIASIGGLVLAAQIPGLRPALAYPTGAEQMPNGVRTAHCRSAPARARDRVPAVQ